MADVVCLGQFTADSVVSPVETLPEKGKAIFVDDISLHNGGCACNTAVALGRLGIDTAVIGKIGRDAFGDFLISVMNDAGLDTSGIVRDPSVSTSSTAVLVHPDGERSFLHYRGGNAALTESDVDFNLINGAKILHVAAAFLIDGIDGEPMARILERARGMGVTTCLDTGWDAEGRWMDLLRPCLDHVDLFVPNLEEAQMLTGEAEAKSAASALRKFGIPTVVLKLGAEGCYGQTPQGDFTIPAFPIEKVVDTLGAGDSFVAGFLAGIVNGWEIERACRLGNAVGACCVRARGATGVRSMQETIDEFDV